MQEDHEQDAWNYYFQIRREAEKLAEEFFSTTADENYPHPFVDPEIKKQRLFLEKCLKISYD